MVNAGLTTFSRRYPGTRCRTRSYGRTKIARQITIVNLQRKPSMLT